MTRHLGIVELRAVCRRMRARNLALFEALGKWVGSTPPGEAQRLYAEACHRHAWHAELWSAREPSIPHDESIEASEPPLDAVTPTERSARYLAALHELGDELAALTERIDPALDPSTARTIALVATDLDDLRGRVPS